MSLVQPGIRFGNECMCETVHEQSIHVALCVGCIQVAIDAMVEVKQHSDSGQTIVYPLGVNVTATVCSPHPELAPPRTLFNAFSHVG